LIAIDESGDTGPNGSRFFVMAAVVSIRSRHLLKAYKAIPTGANEIKFYDATRDERIRVLREIANADVKIVYVCVNKESHYKQNNDSNELYQDVLNVVIRCAQKKSTCRDINVWVDDSSFIKNDDLKNMAKEISKDVGRNVKRCSKVSSEKCVKIADYVAGSISAKYERENDEFFNIIKEKISVAREP